MTLIQLAWLLQLHFGPALSPRVGLVLLVAPDPALFRYCGVALGEKLQTVLSSLAGILPASMLGRTQRLLGVLLRELSSLNESVLWRSPVLLGSGLFFNFFFSIYILNVV